MFAIIEILLDGHFCFCKSNLNLMYFQTQHGERVKRSDPSETKARNQFSGLITIWNTMQKTLCGNPHVIKRSSLPKGKNPSICKYRLQMTRLFSAIWK